MLSTFASRSVNSAKKWTRLLLVTLLISIIILGYGGFCSKKKDRDDFVVGSSGNNIGASGIIGPLGGVVEVTNTASPIYRAKMEIPAAILADNKQVSITRGTAPAMSIAFSNNITATTGGEVINFSIEGTSELNQPIRIVMPYTDADKDGLEDTLNVPTQCLFPTYYDETSSQWKMMPVYSFSIDETNSRIIVETMHLSKWRLAFTKMQEGTEASPRIYYWRIETPKYPPPTSRYPTSLSDADIKTAISQAIAVWDNILPKVKFEFTTSPDADIDFSWEPDGPLFNWYLYAWVDYPLWGLYNSQSVKFNNKYDWEVGNSDPNAIDIRTIAIHEFGHILGIKGDNYNYNRPVMNPSIYTASAGKYRFPLDPVTGIELTPTDILLLKRLGYTVSITLPPSGTLTIVTPSFTKYINSQYPSDVAVGWLTASGGAGWYYWTLLDSYGKKITVYPQGLVWLEGPLYTTPYNTYWFNVYLTDGVDTTPAKNIPIDVIYDAQPPSFGGLLAASAQSPTSVRLQWSPAEDNITSVSDISYRVYIKSSAGYNFNNPNYTTLPGVYSHTIPNRTPGTTYYFIVRAVDKLGNMDSNTKEISVLMPMPVTAPNTPANLDINYVFSSRIVLKWLDMSTNEDGFKIERKIGANGAYQEIAKIGFDATSYSNINLSPATTYYYKVRAYNNNGGDSAYSNEVWATTPELLTLPNAPSGLNATAVSQSDINLTWTDNATNEDSFKIERKTGIGGTYDQIAIVEANKTNYSDTGLFASTTYYYQVKAHNSAGDSTNSNASFATTQAPPVIIPNAPTSLVATAVSFSQINLTWIDNSGNEDGFKIERKTGAGGTYTQIATVGPNTTFYSSTGLQASTTYYYRIKAYNSAEDSSFSNEFLITTLAYPWTEKITQDAIGSPSGRWLPSIVWDGTRVIMFGGWEGTGGQNDLWWYDTITNTWTEKIPQWAAGSPLGRFGASMVWDGTRVILFSGSVMHNDLWWYNPGTNTWTEKIANGADGSPSARQGHQMVWDGQRIIMFGGYDGTNKKNDLWWYNPGTNTWTEKIAQDVASSPSARGSHSMVWDGNRVIMFGGWVMGITNDLWWYDPGTNIWTQKIAESADGSSSARCSPSMVWNGQNVILFGGWYGPNDNDLWWYNPGTNTWTEKIADSTAGSPPDRVYHSMVWDGQRIIMFGGLGSPATIKNDLWWYSP